jgi:hypothetical protein
VLAAILKNAFCWVGQATLWMTLWNQVGRWPEKMWEPLFWSVTAMPTRSIVQEMLDPVRLSPRRRTCDPRPDVLRWDWISELSPSTLLAVRSGKTLNQKGRCPSVGEVITQLKYSSSVCLCLSMESNFWSLLTVPLEASTGGAVHVCSGDVQYGRVT